MTPNYVLVLGAPHSGKIRVVKYLSNDAEFEINEASHSGIIVPANLTNKYFSVDVRFLIDEFPDNRDNATEAEQVKAMDKWYQDFSSSEYAELREAIDGVIFCFNLSEVSETYLEKCLSMLEDFRESMEEMDDTWSGFIVVVGMNLTSPDAVGEIEDAVALRAMEFVNYDEEGTNEFRERLGKDRLREILDTHEWQSLESIPKSPSRCATYEEARQARAEELSEPLTRKPQPMNTKLDLSEVIGKLDQAKMLMDGMTEEQKQTYAKGVVNDLLNFL